MDEKQWRKLTDEIPDTFVAGAEHEYNIWLTAIHKAFHNYPEDEGVNRILNIVQTVRMQEIFNLDNKQL